MKRLVFLLVFLAAPLWAVQPDEVLDDPELEARARALSQDLRCLVCRNENIDDSNAELARDLRLLVRERLVAGDSDEEVIDFIVSRYGEYVLLTPRRGGSNLILYYAGPAMFIFALIAAGLYLRGRSAGRVQSREGLSDDEQARLDEIMKD
ncbi:cytochrome c-type biogenesis protein CcmH [Rhodobacteraceae bacterium 63075]|nr:cytochrome c-type biogenesis protein CcmH [Rhodobacteraceae bacterium 63075]